MIHLLGTKLALVIGKITSTFVARPEIPLKKLKAFITLQRVSRRRDFFKVSLVTDTIIRVVFRLFYSIVMNATISTHMNFNIEKDTVSSSQSSLFNFHWNQNQSSWSSKWFLAAPWAPLSLTLGCFKICFMGMRKSNLKVVWILTKLMRKYNYNLNK